MSRQHKPRWDSAPLSASAFGCHIEDDPFRPPLSFFSKLPFSSSRFLQHCIGRTFRSCVWISSTVQRQYGANQQQHFPSTLTPKTKRTQIAMVFGPSATVQREYLIPPQSHWLVRMMVAMWLCSLLTWILNDRFSRLLEMQSRSYEHYDIPGSLNSLNLMKSFYWVTLAENRPMLWFSLRRRESRRWAGIPNEELWTLISYDGVCSPLAYWIHKPFWW
jgi:hypothetical protein